MRLSRSTIHSILRDLEEEKLLNRRVDAGRPIQVYYSLNEKGSEMAHTFTKLKMIYKCKR